MWRKINIKKTAINALIRVRNRGCVVNVMERTMIKNDHSRIAKEIDLLGDLTVSELQSKWEDVWGEPCRSRNRDYLRKRIGWKIQANVLGGISQRALERARELTDETLIKIRGVSSPMAPVSSQSTTTRHSFRPSDDARLPMPGSLLTRIYNGRKIIVSILDDGFEFEGKPFRSLSAIAKAVTGSHWNGFLFFGIGGGKEKL